MRKRIIIAIAAALVLAVLLTAAYPFLFSRLKIENVYIEIRPMRAEFEWLEYDTSNYPSQNPENFLIVNVRVSLFNRQFDEQSYGDLSLELPENIHKLIIEQPKYTPAHVLLPGEEEFPRVLRYRTVAGLTYTFVLFNDGRDVIQYLRQLNAEIDAQSRAGRYTLRIDFDNANYGAYYQTRYNEGDTVVDINKIQPID